MKVRSSVKTDLREMQGHYIVRLLSEIIRTTKSTNSVRLIDPLLVNAVAGETPDGLYHLDI